MIKWCQLHEFLAKHAGHHLIFNKNSELE
jgi:hypothetical protein